MLATNLNHPNCKKYFCPLKAYDGLSKYYCEKLYPKYSEYERKLRYMVLLMVTKAYGKGWVANTVKGELQENVTAKARNNINRIRMEDVLEYFDLSDLEKYLFLLHYIVCSLIFIKQRFWRKKKSVYGLNHYAGEKRMHIKNCLSNSISPLILLHANISK